MTRPVYSLDLSPRENRHVEPSCARDVGEIVGAATLLFILLVVAALVMTSE